eukprot:12090115-Karenia_brevis.AAC.1
MGWSCCVLFLDLTKAFDYTIRELLIGWPQHFNKSISEKKEYLCRLGVPESVAEQFVTMVDEACILQQLDVDDVSIELLRSLHTGSWFQYGQRKFVISTRKGGRQGCVFGGIVFNMTYAMVLGRVRDEL